MNAETKEALLHDLLLLNKRIFGHINASAIDHLYNDERISASYISCCYNHHDELVGYFSLQVFPVYLGGKLNFIFRGQTGILPTYRRKTAVIFYQIFIILYYRFKYPFARIKCILAILNPGIYKKLANLFNHITPSCDRETDRDEKTLLNTCATYFNFDISNKESPFLVNMGVNSIVSEQEKKYWAGLNDVHLQYYLTINPDYEKGMALLTHIPFHWKNMILSSLRIILFLLKRTTKQVLFRLHLLNPS
jgi:hypothetical protein